MTMEFVQRRDGPMMKRVYSICPIIYYHNEDFQKDCILIPYCIYKVFGIEPVIVTAQPDEYVYARSMTGLVVDVQKAPENNSYDCWIAQMKQYVLEHSSDMDLLFCFGSYGLYETIIPYYKSLRPDGKVILKLDINSYWQDQLSVQREPLKSLFEHCDIITCEGKRLKRFLSNKWPYKLEYLTNGFLNTSKERIDETIYEEKENVILTVGRIGNTLKGNHILLEAFAKCADKYPCWILKLVGSIDQGFTEYINNYWIRFPQLRQRVVFTGKIVDKKKLHEEYRKAKIFVMTSYVEGGTPNVFQEAARYGCYMICSRIDAADEFTNWKRCGMVFPIGDIDCLAGIFEKVLSPDYDLVMRKSSLEIQKYCTRYFDYTITIRKIMHLLQIEGEE